MAKKRAIIVSAKYTPGHISHLAAFYWLFIKLNYDTTLLLDERYRGVFDNTICVEFLGDKTEFKASDITLIYNMSTIDSKIVRRIKEKNAKNITLFVYHEPWYGTKKWIIDVATKRVKPVLLLKNIVIHHFAKKILKAVDVVLLPSQKAVDVYKKYDDRINNNYRLFPLIFTDEVRNISSSKREYLSYVATADKEKNFPLFVEFIKKYFPIDDSLKVQIVTRTDIGEFWDEALQQYVDNSRLVVQAGRNLSNEEINEALISSSCTWLYYYHSTQSGVLARAFMCGSPVLCSSSGCFKDYVDGSNGLICTGDTLTDIYETYCRIIKDNERMILGARESFAKFDYRNEIEHAEDIIKEAERKLKRDYH